MNPEQARYETLWSKPEYRKEAPGEKLAQVFLAQARPKPMSHVIDFGCGTGRGALMLAVLGSCKVTMVDFAPNCLDEELQQALTTQAHMLSFLQADLELPLAITAEYGFCTDVLEHIPQVRVDRVLDTILKAARHVFLSIATEDDVCGPALIGEHVHLTVHDYTWWLAKLAVHGCVIHWSQSLQGRVLFYVTAWAAGHDIVNSGILNTSEEQTKQNVAFNIAQGWEQTIPHVTNDLEVMIVGGGPSLRTAEADIRRLRAEGVKLVTLNGAYNWALDHGLTPSATIVVDARAFNKRFVQPVVTTDTPEGVPSCKYLISSQCDPSVLEGLPKDRTYLWHTISDNIREILTAQYPGGFFPIPGGSSVLLRAIPLLRMLGFKRFHLFGCDSCLDEDQHHAYTQPENDGALVIPVTVGSSRVFHCHAWMISQAQEFMGLIGVLGDEIELEIYGDGLLAHIVQVGAEMADLQEAALVKP